MKHESLLLRIRQGIADMCYIWSREMRQTIADEGVLIFFLLVPLLYPLLYSWAYTNEVVREVPVAVVDMDHSHTSREFLRRVDASPDVKVAYHCQNLVEAQDLMAKQVVHGVLYFPADFSVRLNRGEQSLVGVYCDMSLMLTFKAIYQSSQSVATAMNSRIQIAKAGGVTRRDNEVTAEPMHVDEVQIFNATGGYGNALLPAVLIMIIQQTLLLGIGLGAGTARESNRYQDLVPVSRHYNGIFRIVLGKSMAYFMIFSVMAAYLTMVVPRLFRFTTMATAGALLGLMVPYLLACIFFGMALSCLVRYRENVILLVVFTSVPLLFLTGISWPQSSIPGFWQGVSWLFPSTFGVRGFLRVSSMGATLSDIAVEYQALWVQTLAYFFLTCAVYRHQIISARSHAFDQLERLRSIAAKALRKKSEPAS